MNVFPSLHAWAVTPKEAIVIQKELARQLTFTKPKKALRLIAGVDCAFDKPRGLGYAAVVLWDSLEQKIVEQHGHTQTITFPYVPGLLSFREAPMILEVLSKLTTSPDAVMVDGQGTAHPRRLGIASHLGLITGLPTIGCGKSRLFGTFQEPPQERGTFCPLMDDDEKIGIVLRTCAKIKPVFVSVGCHIDLDTAKEIVMQCNIGYRLPEPTRQADKWVAKFKLMDQDRGVP